MASDKIINISTDNFDSTIAAAGAKPVLVDFWAPWCGPCKAIAPLLDELAGELDSVQITKVNVDENSALAGKFNVRAIPTLLIFKNGEIVDQVVGMTNKGALKAKLEAHV